MDGWTDISFLRVLRAVSVVVVVKAKDMSSLNVRGTYLEGDVLSCDSEYIVFEIRISFCVLDEGERG